MFDFIHNELDGLVMVALCILLSALFAASETAITSLNNIKVKHLMQTQGKSAQHLMFWINHPERVLTTVLFYNSIVNILASAIITNMTNKYVSNGVIGVATGATTFLVLIFGEISPKALAKTYSDKIAVSSIIFIRAAYILSFPILRTISVIVEFFINKISRGKNRAVPLVTEAEIELMVSEGGKAGIFQDLKKEIIEGAFEFDETRVKEVMIPRTDISSISHDTPVTQIIDLILRTGHSRIPVYRNNIDTIIGLVLAKDVLRHQKNPDKSMTAKDIMRDAIFAPEAKSIMGVFKDLKRAKSHMAIIIDEYGGTAGIVTMEDILEEIVGDIQDEFDSEEAKILPLASDVFEVAGSIRVEDFMEYFKIEKEDIPEEFRELEADTLAGWITQLKEQMPKIGLTATIGPLTLEVTQVKQRRIEFVKVKRNASSS